MTAHPTLEESRRWALFVDACEKHGEALLAYDQAGRAGKIPVADRMNAARRLTKRKVMPVDQQRKDSPLHRLLQLAESWAPMTLTERLNWAQRLRDMAKAARPVLATPDPQEQRRRADIFD